MMRSATIALAMLIPMPAAATVEWAEWSGFPGDFRTGTFSCGSTVTLTGASFPGSGSVNDDTIFTSSPPVVGLGGSIGNPPYQQILSGPASGVLINPGDFVVEIDFSALPAGVPPVFGLADQKFTYRLELRDSAETLLPLTGVTVTPHEIHYGPLPPSFPDGLVADQNSTIVGQNLQRDFLNDAVPTDFYNQTGLTVFTTLPDGTATVRMFGATISESEGLSFFVGADFPEKDGDTNGDGKTNVIDALKALRISVDLDEVTPEILAHADINEDCELSILDALAILKLSVA